jgi:hypothetical protein
VTSNERQTLLDAYGNAYTLLTQALARFPREMWDYKPAPREWNIRQNLVHLADTEIAACGRIRKAIAEPGGLIFAFDQDAWADSMAYAEQSAETALELFRAIRQSTTELLRLMPESAWKHTVQHPERGPLTVAFMVEYFENHTHLHIRQMQAVYEAWCKLPGSRETQS